MRAFGSSANGFGDPSSDVDLVLAAAPAALSMIYGVLSLEKWRFVMFFGVL